MFKWIKNLFVTAEAVTVPVESLPEVKVETVKPVAEPKKVVSAAPVTKKVTKASLSSLSKVKLEEFAKATYGVDIDRRKKKDDLVKEVLKLSKKA
jgi:hypothetical protein